MEAQTIIGSWILFSLCYGCWSLMVLDNDHPIMDLTDKTKKQIKKLLVLVFIANITSFLWAPWLALGLNTVHRKNMAIVNDAPREEKVLEPKEKVRPSIQDKK